VYVEVDTADAIDLTGHLALALHSHVEGNAGLNYEARFAA
jgi:hypothetical protein